MWCKRISWDPMLLDKAGSLTNLLMPHLTQCLGNCKAGLHTCRVLLRAPVRLAPVSCCRPSWFQSYIISRTLGDVIFVRAIGMAAIDSCSGPQPRERVCLIFYRAIPVQAALCVMPSRGR